MTPYIAGNQSFRSHVSRMTTNRRRSPQTMKHLIRTLNIQSKILKDTKQKKSGRKNDANTVNTLDDIIKKLTTPAGSDELITNIKTLKNLGDALIDIVDSASSSRLHKSSRHTSLFDSTMIVLREKLAAHLNGRHSNTENTIRFGKKTLTISDAINELRSHWKGKKVKAGAVEVLSQWLDIANKTHARPQLKAQQMSTKANHQRFPGFDHMGNLIDDNGENIYGTADDVRRMVHREREPIHQSWEELGLTPRSSSAERSSHKTSLPSPVAEMKQMSKQSPRRSIIEILQSSIDNRSDQEVMSAHQTLPNSSASDGRLDTNYTIERTRRSSENRYTNILPSDNNAIPVDPTKPQDYNSNYINASNIDDRYIAAQGPLGSTNRPDLPDSKNRSTVKKFWNMLINHSSNVIVMLARPVENNRPKCAKYWPGNVGDSIDIGNGRTVVCQKKEQGPWGKRRTFIVKENGRPSRTIVQYHKENWPDHGVPDNVNDTVSLLKEASKMTQALGGGPMTVHCSAGVGRTGVAIAIDKYQTMIDQIVESQRMDALPKVEDVARDIRHKRAVVIQTPEQLNFIRHAVNHMLNAALKKMNTPQRPVSHSHDVDHPPIVDRSTKPRLNPNAKGTATLEHSVLKSFEI